MAKLDTLELTEDEHDALAVLLAAGLESGRQEPEVSGFAPGDPCVLSHGLPLATHFGAPEKTEVAYAFQGITVTAIAGGTSTSDSWTG